MLSHLGAAETSCKHNIDILSPDKVDMTHMALLANKVCKNGATFTWSYASVHVVTLKVHYATFLGAYKQRHIALDTISSCF